MKELLDAIVANPADDAVRRVYADALLEEGEPLGELIHVQLDLATGGLSREAGIARRKRERELWLAHRERWTAPLADLAVDVQVRRGFVEEARVDAGVLVDRGDDLFARAPLLR
ncbi:MAG TPA: TIGR02996 domain-containing protein, partial [Xanthomonadales bacterium]|nr:TIGR02996 domain-containing protein [Xanthomonadales bacterium]